MNNLEQAQMLKKRFDRETWIERKKFFIMKAKSLKTKFKEGCGKEWKMWNPETEEDDHYGKCRHDLLCPKCEEAIKVLEKIK